MRTFLLSLTLVILLPTFSFSTPSVSMEEFVSLVTENNSEIRKAVRNLAEAREDLGGILTLEATRFDLSGGVTYTPPEDEETDQEGTPGTAPLPAEEDVDNSEWSGSAGVTVPLVPQIALGGNIKFGEEELAGSVSLTLSPFAQSALDPSDEESLRKASLNLTYVRKQAVLEAEQAALNLTLARWERDQAENQLNHERSSYEIIRQVYELGDATLDDVQESAKSLSAARQSFYDAEGDLITAEKTTILLVGPDVESITIESLTLEELIDLVEARQIQLLDLETGGTPSSLALETLTIELEGLQADLARTWQWRPDLSFTTEISLPFEDFEAKVALSFSPGDIKSDDRNDLENDIRDKIDDMKSERYSLEVEIAMNEHNLSIAEEALQYSLTDLDQALLGLKESELLHTQGHLTKLELEAAKIHAEEARLSVFSAASDLYRILGDALIMYNA